MGVFTETQCRRGQSTKPLRGDAKQYIKETADCGIIFSHLQYYVSQWESFFLLLESASERAEKFTNWAGNAGMIDLQVYTGTTRLPISVRVNGTTKRAAVEATWEKISALSSGASLGTEWNSSANERALLIEFSGNCKWCKNCSSSSLLKAVLTSEMCIISFTVRQRHDTRMINWRQVWL